MAKFEKTNPFEVPADYFQNLPGNITERLQIKHDEVSILDKLIRLALKPQYSLSLISIIAIFIITVIVFDRTDEINGLEEQLQTVSTEEIQNFINDNIEDFDAEMIYENMMVEADVTEIDDELYESIREYLIDELDENTIMEELL